MKEETFLFDYFNLCLKSENQSTDLDLNMKYRTIDLFSGIGGIRLGFERTGFFKTVFSNDIDAFCKKTYDLNFSIPKLHVEDIRNIDATSLPKFDVLTAGFPCQAFSIAGYRKGFNDDKGRGNVFFEIVRIIEKNYPQVVFLENVKNLVTHDNGQTFKIICQALEKNGYHIKYQVLNSMDYGEVPQNRERIYIVGFKNKKIFNLFSFPQKTPSRPSILDFLERNVDSRFHYNGKPLYSRIKDDIAKEGVSYQWRRKYVRENKSKVFPTLTANMGTGGHNVPIVKQGSLIRKITPKECSVVQGFPKDFKLPAIADSHLYKQFGNSVTISVIERIAFNIGKALRSST